MKNFEIKTLHKYILKEFFFSFLFAMAVFSVLLLLDRIFDLAGLFLSKGVSLWTIVKLFFYIYPNILPLAVPMSILFGIFLSYGRLSDDNEITAMKANACSYKTITLPMLILTAVLSFILIFFNSFITPLSQHKTRALFAEILVQSPLITFQPKTSVDLGEYTIYANNVDKKSRSLSGVSIYKFDKPSKQKTADGGSSGAAALKNSAVSWRITASSAAIRIYKNGVGFILYNGYWQKNSAANLNSMTHITFNSYSFFIPTVSHASGQSVSVQELNSIEILKKIKDSKEKQLPYTAYSIEFCTRLLFAAAPFIFALIAVPMALRSNKGAKTLGFIISLAILISYYMLLLLSISIAEKKILSPFIIIWMPDLIGLLCGIFLFRRMLKR